MLKTFIEVTLQVILILSSWYAVLSVDVVDVMLLQNPSKQTTYYSAYTMHLSKVHNPFFFGSQTFKLLQANFLCFKIFPVACEKNMTSTAQNQNHLKNYFSEYL